MKYYSVLILVFAVFGCSPIQQKTDFNTFCNPLDLDYRFQLEGASRREAADPTVVTFDDKYFLFASKSGGYWYSDDLVKWIFIETNQIPTEDYAPTAVAIDDTLYFLASSYKKCTIYKSADPISGNWQVAKDSLAYSVWDPDLFLDDDGKLFLYWGCSNKIPIKGIELDYKNDFEPVGKPVELISAKPKIHGWEIPGDYNTRINNPQWLEGAWMNKYKGKYYLQYAAPGTEFKCYSDGVYVGESPLGPFAPAAHNPFAYKPEGFAAGAGHGSTFEDKYGNFWHIGTMSISVKHPFERRLGLFPTFFDQDEILYSNTKFGDYPMVIPKKKIDEFNDVFPEWMLLSYAKEVTVSSSVDSLPSSNMVDEDIRTYWSAQSGDGNEWACVDLDENCDIYAIQVNFAEHETKIYGRPKGLTLQYILECSDDKETWHQIVDQSKNRNDRSHAYFQLAEKINSRFVRIRNVHVPDGKFALSGFRIFGKGSGSKPEPVGNIELNRNEQDRRSISLHWNKSKNATGYNVCYGINDEKLYQHYQIYKDTSITINSLNASLDYYFTVEPFNQNGINP